MHENRPRGSCLPSNTSDWLKCSETGMSIGYLTDSSKSFGMYFCGSSSPSSQSKNLHGQTRDLIINPFPAKPFTLLMLFSSKSRLKEMLKRPKNFILRTQLRCRMYQKLEFMQEVSIHYPTEAYKLHTVYFATDLI